MPSTPSTSNRFELQAVGENNDTWGEKLMDALRQTDQALDGLTTVNLSGADAEYTLVVDNYEDDDEARRRVLHLTGTLTGTGSVVIPNVTKTYLVINDTDAPVEIGTGSGTSATVPADQTRWVVSLGGNVVRVGGGLGSMADVNRATTAQLRARESDTGVTSQGIRDALAYVNIPYASTMTLNGEAGVNFESTLTGNVTSFEVSDPIVGATYAIEFVGNNATPRTVTFHSNFKNPPLLNDITSSKGYEVTFKVRTATRFIPVALRSL